MDCDHCAKNLSQYQQSSSGLSWCADCIKNDHHLLIDANNIYNCDIPSESINGAHYTWVLKDNISIIKNIQKKTIKLSESVKEDKVAPTNEFVPVSCKYVYYGIKCFCNKCKK